MIKTKTRLPLISCICPTRNRRKFIKHAIKLFQNQDYPNKELLIIDDGTDLVASLIPHDPTIRYIAIQPERLTIGMKRNLACSLAQGELIVSHDDDDYYGPQRLSKQAEPIISGDADCSAMRMSLLLDANEETLWTCSDITHKLCFKQDIHYGTLMFKASYWQNGTHFANANIGEDRRFVHAMLAQDARLERIVDPHSFAYVLHGKNTTSDMRLVHSEGWEQVSFSQYLPEEEQQFYQQFAEVREDVLT